MNVSLTPKLEESILHKVESVLYNNADEVIRDGVRLLIERDAIAKRETGALGEVMREDKKHNRGHE